MNYLCQLEAKQFNIDAVNYCLWGNIMMLFEGNWISKDQQLPVKNSAKATFDSELYAEA